jgi:hypothetical protein
MEQMLSGSPGGWLAQAANISVSSNAAVFFIPIAPLQTMDFQKLVEAIFVHDFDAQLLRLC